MMPGGWRAAGVALPVILGLLWVAGPRPSVDLPDGRPAIPGLPAELSAYLASREASLLDIVPGTEKRIIWADPDRPARTELAIVYLHGFSATHRETAPLTEQLAQALGANAYLARLTGHGRTAVALGAASAGDWLADAVEAMQIGTTIGRRVVVLGVSTGATLATWIAADPEWRDDVAALVMISPNFALNDSRAWILTSPWGAQLAELIQGPEYSFEPQNDLHARYWTERFPTAVLPQLAALVALIDRGLVERIEAPTLVFVSPEDRVIDVEAARARFAELGVSDKELIEVTEADDTSDHVLVGDILSPGTTPAVMRRILSFVRRVVELGPV